MFLVAFCWIVIGAVPVPAQKADSTRGPAPIQDNSFLVEEAYNQEAGVVQHINTFMRATRANTWAYTFTQEWPLGGLRHQLSYTVPYARVDEAPGARAGVGDVALNYRYQLLGDGDATIAVAPRLSALIPTGSSRRGLGAGGPGVQLNLPLSVVLGGSLVAHSNAGATYTPRAHNELGDEARAVGMNLGQSIIWLASANINLMLEGAWSRGDAVVGPEQTERSTAVFLSPGVRGAINFASGLQIVPGIAFPIGVGPSRGERNVFLYLSFEHRFTSAAR